MDNFIEFKNITKRFPGVCALSNVSFSIKKGEVHALVGENGAGKSTLMNILGGKYLPTEGQVFIDNKEIHFKNQAASIAKGIGIVYQELELCNNLTVSQNIFLGQEKINGKIDWKKNNEKANILLDKLGGNFKGKEYVSSLCLANQQLVEIARALSRNANIIVMDEPTSSLTVTESQHLFNLISQLKKNGKTIIYISHRMEEVFEISDSISVLRDGRYLGTFDTKEATNEKIIQLIAGKEMLATTNKMHIREYDENEKPILELRNVSKKGLYKNINLKLYANEILGLYGIQGAGRTELFEGIFGINPIDSGEILLNGKVVVNNSPEQAIDNGFAMVPEDRFKYGIFSKMNIRENICSSRAFKKTKKHSLILDNKKMQEKTLEAIDEFSIRASSQEQLISQLSGGNQQKAILGKWLISTPNVLLIDEPTRGVDVGAKAEIFEILRTLNKKGVAILMVSSELAEVISQSNRTIVMKDGKFVAEFLASEVTKEKIVEAAILNK